MFDYGFPKDWSTLKKLAFLRGSGLGGGGSYITLVGDIVRFMASRSAPFRKLQIALEPIQDLNGYDSPWPAGGSDNFLPLTVAALKAANSSATWSGNSCTINNVTFTIVEDAGGNVTGINVNGTANANTFFYACANLSASGTVYMSGCPSSGSDATHCMYASESGSVKGFDTGDGLTMSIASPVNVIIRVMSGTQVTNALYKPSLSTTDIRYANFVPYSNICPISGRTSATVTRTGKNLFDPTYRSNLTANIRFYYNTTGFLLKANTAYTFSVSSPSAQNTILEIGGSQLTANYGRTSITYTPTQDVYVWFDAYYAGNYPVPSGGTAAVNCQLELGSTATDYEEYRGTTYPIPLGQTVYGGTLDVTAGTLTVDRAMVDLGAFDYNGNTYAGVFGGLTVVTPAPKPVSALSTVANAVCSALKVVSDTVFNNDGFKAEISVNTLGYVKVKGVNATTSQELKAEMSGVQLVYELATPIEITLTPQIINSLVGENNVWDDGTLTVEVKGEAIT